MHVISTSHLHFEEIECWDGHSWNAYCHFFHEPCHKTKKKFFIQTNAFPSLHKTTMYGTVTDIT